MAEEGAEPPAEAEVDEVSALETDRIFPNHSGMCRIFQNLSGQPECASAVSPTGWWAVPALHSIIQR